MTATEERRDSKDDLRTDLIKLPVRLIDCRPVPMLEWHDERGIYFNHTSDSPAGAMICRMIRLFRELELSTSEDRRKAAQVESMTHRYQEVQDENTKLRAQLSAKAKK
jgi:hypothetical protein